MKTAEEIIKEINPDNSPTLWTDAMVLQAMQSYASQPQGMSAEQVEPDFADYLKNAKNDFLNTINRQQWDINLRMAAESFVIAYDQAVDKLLSTSPSVKPDGWIMPNNITIEDIKEIRNYFAVNDKTIFEHRAYNVMYWLEEYFTPPITEK